jgi:hypothetical protein
VLARIPLLSRLTRLPDLPVTPALPLPAKFRIRFLEPVRTDRAGAEVVDDESLRQPWNNEARVRALGEDVRALIQENLLEMVAARRSVWLG